MNIVLDTNVLYDDWYLSGPNFSVIEKLLEVGDARLFVPEIVVLEAENLFRKELAKSVNSLAKSMAKLRRLIPDEDALQELPDVDEKSTEYDTKLDQRLAKLRAERPGHSDISHDAIVARALGPRKPFREGDKGYRDALLWEVIWRKIAPEDTTTFFISKNYKDFAAKPTDRMLHSELIEDLVSGGLPKDSVQFYSDLKSFVDEQVKSRLKAIVDEIVNRLREQGSYKSFSVAAWFKENHDAILEKVNEKIGSAFAHIYSELEDPRVTNIEDPEKVEVIEVTRYEGDEQLYHIDVSVLADMAIDVFVFKSDYYSGVGEEVPLDVWDSDWNEHYIWAVVEAKLELPMSLVFDASKETVENFEVNSIGEFWGWCRFCRAQIMSETAEECWNCGRSFG